jgi:hypothetical protein
MNICTHWFGVSVLSDSWSYRISLEKMLFFLYIGKDDAEYLKRFTKNVYLFQIAILGVFTEITIYKWDR